MLALALVSAALAQAPVSTVPAANTPASALPAFEVVSAKPFRPTAPWPRSAQFDPQRLYIEGMNPVELINLAYSLNDNQLTGLPVWAQSSGNSLYSITGVTEKPASRAQMLLMLRRVLAERFQLVVSESNNVQHVIFLDVARGGPQLTPVKPGEDCEAALHALPRPQPQYQEFFPACSISKLVTELNNPLGQDLVHLPVIDRTGLTGSYAMRVLVRVADVTPLMVNGKRVGNKVGYMEPVTEALPRELGLELVKGNAPYRVLNVVHIARPSPNN